jgi:hypothetical protein
MNPTFQIIIGCFIFMSLFIVGALINSLYGK